MHIERTEEGGRRPIAKTNVIRRFNLSGDKELGTLPAAPA